MGLFEPLYGIKKLFKGSFIDAYVGLSEVKIASGEDPLDCSYVRKALKEMSKNGELDSLIECCEAIVELREKGEI